MSTHEVLLLTIRDVAKATALSTRTINRETRRGSLPVIRVGRSVRYEHDDVVAYVNARRNQVAASNEKRG